MPQVIKMFGQRAMAVRLIHEWKPDFLSIEKPFVLPMASRGGGGEQSSNLYALYSLILLAASEASLPIAMFHISQLRSLIHGRGGTNKQDTIDAAAREIGKTPEDEHQADAYFIAKFGLNFWLRFDGLSGYDCPTKEDNIYSSTDLVGKGKPRGMIYRPGEYWFDFRKHRPAEIPEQWQNLFQKQ